MKKEKEIKKKEEKEKIEEEDEEEGGEKKKLIFKGLTIFVSRECPKTSMEFIIKAFGGNCTFNDTPKITHHIIEKDTIPKDLEKKKNQENSFNHNGYLIQ